MSTRRLRRAKNELAVEFSLGNDVAAIDREGVRTQSARVAPFAITKRGYGTFCRLVGRQYTAIALPDVAADETWRAVERPGALLEGHETVVKLGRSALIVKSTLCLSESEMAVAYKRCGSRNWLRRLMRSLQTPRAVRNFHLGHSLLRFGIPTPRPLLAVSPRWRAFFGPSYLATQWIEGVVPIDAFLRETSHLDGVMQRTVLCEAAQSLGHLIGTLHARGFTHRDLKATNLLLRESAGRVEAFVIDLDGAARPWFLSRRTRMTNLARLVLATDEQSLITHSLRRRALRSYLTAAADRAPWKTVWRELTKISRIRRSRRAARSR